MLVLNAEQIRKLVSMPALIEALRVAFFEDCVTPPRQIVSAPGGESRLLLSMPAFAKDGSGVVKLTTVFPDNAAHGLPTIQGALALFSDKGAPLAIMDAATITKLRTAATSALASSYLSRTDSTRLVVAGTGALAPYMAYAHACVRPLRSICFWGRERARAEVAADLARNLIGPAVGIDTVEDLQSAVRNADIVSCATSSAEPFFCGEWLEPGVFIDLVGSFSPNRREADDATVCRARLFVDTFAGALEEAGDLLQPLARGVICRGNIEGELADLEAGRVSGRRSEEEITLFKSVGTALEDLVAAQLAYRAAGQA